MLQTISSNKRLQALLQNEKESSSKHSTSDESTKSSHQETQQLKQYFDHLCRVGCQEISISHLDDKKNASTLFKLIEKCKRLQNESIEKEQSLRQRKTNLETNSKECDAMLVISLKECKEAKVMAMREYEKEEKEIEDLLNASALEHEKVMADVSEELMSIQLKQLDHQDEAFVHDKHMGGLQAELVHMQQNQVNHDEEEYLQKRMQELEIERNGNKNQQLMQQKKLNETIQKIESNFKAETEEKNYLNLRYALVQSNKEIAAKEERLLERVALMEAKADDVMFHAAVGLQKIVRGVRDRAIAKKAKKKRKNGKKKSGKGNKSKR